MLVDMRIYAHETRDLVGEIREAMSKRELPIGFMSNDTPR